MSYTQKLQPALLILAAIVAWYAADLIQAESVLIDFDDPTLVLPPESQWDGVDDTFGDGVGQSNEFESRGASFNNEHQHEDWGHAWQGWAYSNRTDTAETGPPGQYTAMADPAGGHDGSSQYGVGYVGFSASPWIDFGGLFQLHDAQFTNNGFAHDSMTNGDGFAKKFGGDDGDDPDWLLLTISGRLQGTETGSVDFYLADYRFANNAEDFIVDDWTAVDLSSLGVVDVLEFDLTSTDNGMFGMNTPAYFVMDSLAVDTLGGYADFDSDGDVDGDDFLIWQTGFGLTTATRQQGDADADADVDGDDFLIWQSESSGAGSAQRSSTVATIPEPSAWSLALLFVVGWAKAPRGKRPLPPF